jgi:hypothetical protein
MTTALVFAVLLIVAVGLMGLATLGGLVWLLVLHARSRQC